MKKTSIITIFMLACTLPMWGQAVMDALPNISNELKGTARYASMGGAFGALGGDLSSIAQNPAGIGVYRSSEITVTPTFNFYDNCVTTPTKQNRNNDFYFTGDNMGVVGVINFRQGILRNLNFGFAYNNVVTFNNSYRADWNNIGSSLTNLIASKTTNYNYTPQMLAETSQYNPYDTSLSWLSVLGYNTNLIHAVSDGNFQGIFGSATSGSAALSNYTSGSIDEYDFNISGNILDALYWGVTVNVNSITYNIESYYAENLFDANVSDNRVNNRQTYRTNGRFELQNLLHTSGYGAGVKVGLIWRVANFLRLGAAFHSPTFYDMSDTYSAAVDYRFENVNGKVLSGDKNKVENQTDLGTYSYSFATPWRLMGSAAFVLGKIAILSCDYEYTATADMYYSSMHGDYSTSNLSIDQATQGIHTIRVGGECRITPQFSARVGYAYETSPIKPEYYNGEYTPTIVDGTLVQYQVPGDVHNITCGLGYRINNISIDAAYVHRMQKYSLFPFEGAGSSFVPSIMDTHLNTVKVTVGYRF